MIAPAFVALLGTLAMMSLALGLWIPAYRRQRTLRRRLDGFVLAGTTEGFALDLGGRRRSRTARRANDDHGRRVLRWIAVMIEQAQADVSVGEVLAAMATLAALAFTLAIVFTSLLAVGIAAALFGGGLPLLWLTWQRRRLARKFSDQLLDTIALLASSVRSGHSLLQALEHVVSEAPEPTRSTIALVVREIGLGASQEDALERVADRLPSEDLELIVSAINVHHQIGGSLARVLDSIAETIQERGRIAGDIRSLTAQQRFSAYVLSLLPVAVGLVLYLVSPDYIAPLFRPGALRFALIGASTMVVSGFLIMEKMASIDV
ncbi:MAG TPA: type II secretion system F family protein [Candidatus Acidoferrales bacterium]|nr:type II secretion system F family protein [Candidatus Acidoferrales bacterium]